MVAKIWAVVPAGGVGTRMQTVQPKQYLLLHDKSVVEHTLARLAKVRQIDGIFIGIANNDSVWQGLDFPEKKEITVVEAGAQRVKTVENCLRHIIQHGGINDWALVHDAARPCVRPAEVQKLLEVVIGTDNGGLLALPVSDTLKRGNEDDSQFTRVMETVPRKWLWRAMTPQMFKVGELLTAIEHAHLHGIEITDEASAMEVLGVQPLLIPCSPDNIKITLPHDIQFAEMILSAQRGSAI